MNAQKAARRAAWLERTLSTRALPPKPAEDSPAAQQHRRKVLLREVAAFHADHRGEVR